MEVLNSPASNGGHKERLSVEEPSTDNFNDHRRPTIKPCVGLSVAIQSNDSHTLCYQTNLPSLTLVGEGFFVC